MRISAIIDAGFRLIVDGVSAQSWTRSDACKLRAELSQSSADRRKSADAKHVGTSLQCRLIRGGGRRLRRTVRRGGCVVLVLRW